MTKTIKMTKVQPGAVAVANVLPDQVKAWEADGWSADQPSPKASKD